jgi:hypothetical protein
MYKKQLMFESQLIVKAIALANGAIDLSSYVGLRAGKAEGKLKMSLRANGAVTQGAAATITMTETSIDTEDGTFVASNPTVSRVQSVAAETTYTDKQEIMSMLISKEANKFVRPTLVLGGTFGTTAGNVDVYLEYVPS